MSMHPSINYFKQYKGNCRVFIETGTYKGEGMQLAQAAGFHTIHSIDIVEHEQTFNYEGIADVKRYIDDSSKVLKWLIPTINDRIMFWLDAHSQQFENEPDNFPLLRELSTIAYTCKYPPVILIDDFLMMSHPDVTGWNKQRIEEAVRDIGDARIEYLSNPVRNNIMLVRYE